MLLTPHSIQILKINELAKKQNAIRFDKGSPSPSIPSKIKTESLIELSKLMNEHYNNYPSQDGYLPLVDIIKDIEFSVNLREVINEEICLTNGALSGLFFILSTLLNKNDIVMVNELCFEGFISIIKSLELTLLPINFDNLLELEKNIKSNNPKIIIINSPENPSGKIYSKKFLEHLNILAGRYNFLIISDEVNNQNIFSPYTYIPPSNHIMKDILITINSFSKNYFLPGVRLGWIIAVPEIITKLKKTITISQVGINFISQINTYFIIRNFQKDIEQFRIVLARKKKFTEELLQREKLDFLQPVMAGSVFFIDTSVDSEDVFKYLLKKYKMAIIPGTYFGKKWKNWIRVGFSVPTNEEIENYIPKINEAKSQIISSSNK